MSEVVFPRAHLDTTTTGLNEPLSLTLSPLRGARELAYRRVVVGRCPRRVAGPHFPLALWRGGVISVRLL